MKKVLMFLADGLEECEGLITVDLLRRAGVEVTMASITDRWEVTSSHNIQIKADALLQDLKPMDYDMAFLPGGGVGTANLKASEAVTAICREFASREDKQLAAICAAPTVLGQLGLLQGKQATCYPGWEEQLLGCTYTGAAVTVCENMTTGKGMGVTIPFALQLIDRLMGREKAEEIGRQIQYL